MSWAQQVSPLSARQTERRKLRALVVTFVVVASGSSLLLWAAGMADVRTHFVVSFIWLLALAELYAPSDPDSVWWRRLAWLKIAGWLVLGFIVYERVMAVVA